MEDQLLPLRPLPEILAMLSLGAAKVLGILLESLVYGERSVSTFIPCLTSPPAFVTPNDRRVPLDVRIQYVSPYAQPLGSGGKQPKRVHACRVDGPVRDHYHCE